jgi:hypothetical protein
LNGNSVSKPAYFEHFKSSDIRNLSADAKIIISLMRKQPQKRLELIKNSHIHPTTFSRHKRHLTNREIIKESANGYSLWNYKEQESLWDSLLCDLENVGGKRLEARVQRASYIGRDSETGWRQFAYAEEDRICGAIVLKKAPRMVNALRPFGIFVRDDDDGVFLTAGQIDWKDRLWSGDRLYEVESVEERFSGNNIGFRVGRLIEIAESRKGEARAAPPIHVSDAQSQLATRLTAGLNTDNITKDNCSERAAYQVMFANPNYEIVQEFYSLTDPLDGIYVVGESKTEQLIDASRLVYGYDEHVPVFVYTVDKEGISGTLLRRKMEAELRRVCEEAFSKDRHYGHLERHGDQRRVSNGLTVYSTEFIWSFSRTAR